MVNALSSVYTIISLFPCIELDLIFFIIFTLAFSQKTSYHFRIQFHGMNITASPC